MVEGSTSESSSGVTAGEASSPSSSSSTESTASGNGPTKNGSSKSHASTTKASSSDGAEKELLNGMSKEKYMSFKPQSPDRIKSSPMEVIVDHGVERAIKVLKRKLIKEGLFKELKSRRYYSKPSEEKKRKLKESLKKIRKEEARRQKSQMMF